MRNKPGRPAVIEARHKEMLEQMILQGFSSAEIAKLFNLTPGGVTDALNRLGIKSLRQRSKERLAEKMKSLKG